MKMLFLIALISMNVSAHVFECRDGDNVDTLVLTDNEVRVLDFTLINMMDVNRDLPYRDYSFINDPWYDFLAEVQMLDGKEGYAELRGHELQYGETTFARYYWCTPKP